MMIKIMYIYPQVHLTIIKDQNIYMVEQCR
uniref:Uncharacterized protein n=1 Tax=Rhizophora mucronata TaxID=61149 RepID=A0A2P2N594_RHIMU